MTKMVSRKVCKYVSLRALVVCKALGHSLNLLSLSRISTGGLVTSLFYHRNLELSIGFLRDFGLRAKRLCLTLSNRISTLWLMSKKLLLTAVGFIAGMLGYFIVSLILTKACNASEAYVDAPGSQRDWVLGLEELSIDYRNHAVLNASQRDPLLYPESPKEAINVNIKTNLLQVFSWDSQIQSLTSDSQYRAVGLQTTLVLRLTQSLEGGYWHQSNHLLDRSSATLPRFPSQDALMVKLYLFRASSGRESLF